MRSLYTCTHHIEVGDCEFTLTAASESLDEITVSDEVTMHTADRTRSVIALATFLALYGDEREMSSRDARKAIEKEMSEHLEAPAREDEEDPRIAHGDYLRDRMRDERGVR